MAAVNCLNQLQNVTAFVFVILIMLFWGSSSARPLSSTDQNNNNNIIIHPNNNNNNNNNLAASIEPGLNIVLPVGDDQNIKPVLSSNQYNSDHDRFVIPCDMESTNNLAPATEEKRTGKYGSMMVLNLLPKGTVPPSGPSKGTNDMNN
ncbi:hypothetical protein BVC80_1837g58 [Macleaya cordata]|uniref:Uncharacterized protein n=1 Tax=Macleaya cordata TaxID=56857 RepID=A0A200R3H4_MACCD|nr:hypothetical protein BVC80_1837g58 [Macleaya cordata]